MPSCPTCGAGIRYCECPMPPSKYNEKGWLILDGPIWGGKSKEKTFTKEYCLALFDKIKHGDQEHQDWLEKEIKEYFK